MTHWTQVIFQLCIKALAIVEEIFTIEPSRKLQINLFQLNLIIPFFIMAMVENFTFRPSRELQINLLQLNLITYFFTMVEEHITIRSSRKLQINFFKFNSEYFESGNLENHIFAPFWWCFKYQKCATCNPLRLLKL